ncbi:Mur ligase family protein, partial [Enterococcus faecium]|uniref:Mur ligase family protein n=1 Tax=Enterococcus faecium TaxID=1352 RepID=UPI003CC53A41
IAVITNIYEAHIDYHGTRKEFVKAKWNLQKNMTEKVYLILNWHQSQLQELAQRTKPRVLPFSTKEVLEDGVYADDYSINYKKEKIMEISELGVPGKHNV